LLQRKSEKKKLGNFVPKPKAKENKGKKKTGKKPSKHKKKLPNDNDNTNNNNNKKREKKQLGKNDDDDDDDERIFFKNNFQNSVRPWVFSFGTLASNTTNVPRKTTRRTHAIETLTHSHTHTPGVCRKTR